LGISKVLNPVIRANYTPDTQNVMAVIVFLGNEEKDREMKDQ